MSEQFEFMAIDMNVTIRRLHCNIFIRYEIV